MSFLKEKIDEIKQVKNDKLNYYNDVKDKLTELKKQIVSLYSNPKENIIDVIKNVAEYNDRVSMLALSLHPNTSITSKDITLPYIKLNEERVIVNLVGKNLKKTELHTNHISIYAYYNTLEYYGLVKFIAYCDESVDVNKFYTVDEINNLIREEKLVKCSELYFDFRNKKEFESSKDINNEILGNLTDINYPIELKDKVEIIENEKLEDIDNKIEKNISLDMIFALMDNLTDIDTIKKVLTKEIENINQSYSSIESILCASIVYEISNLFKTIAMEEENVKVECKQKIKELLNEVENDLKEISEIELNI